jgi:Protein of unknown function (DUF4089)
MTDPTDALRSYVRAALELQGYKFTEERSEEITRQFARIESIARTLLPPGEGLEAQLDLGTAPVFRP